MSVEEFEKENQELGRNFMERLYFSEWEKSTEESSGNRNSLEIQPTYNCNLNCKYCYVDRYGEDLFEEASDEKVLENTEALLDWLIENNYNPRMEIFSGEPLIQPVVYDILDMILDKFEDAESKPPQVVIPTNFTWIKMEDKVERLDEIMERGRKVGIEIGLSASIDGKYCAENRPPVMFDEDDYDRLFEFARKWRCGFHPMIYSEEIEHWKDNWDWFQEMFDKYNIPFSNIYLLEVRNKEWSTEQIKQFGEFLEYLIEWTIDEVGKDNYWNFVLENNAFNILSNSFGTVGRGIGCSIQSCVMVRLPDLKFGPCHRLSYDEFILGQFRKDNGKVSGVDIKNPDLLIGHTAFDNNYIPQCDTCRINQLCSGQCLGSQYEETGDMFSPIPSVCRMEFYKIYSMIKKLKEEGLLEEGKKFMNDRKVVQIEFLESEME